MTGVLITAVGLVDEPDDHTSFTPMLEQAEETTGSKAPMTLADAGYYSGDQLGGLRWQGPGGGHAGVITATVSRSSVPQGPVRLR